MANASQASAYEIFQLEKSGKSPVVITGENPYGARTYDFSYYESLLSPNITAILTAVDVGGSVKYDKEYDNQERFGTLSSAFLKGEVDVKFKIVSKLGELDFSKNPLVFDKQVNPDQESQREAIVMSLVSRSAKKNLENKVDLRYSGNIGDSVRKILKQYLQISDNKISITPTKNPLPFIGNSEPLFDLMCWLASQSSPVDGNPGYFFYETKNGYNFRSVDELISQAPKAEYTMSAVLRSGIENEENDFKILRKNEIKRQDLISSLKAGIFQSRLITLDLKNRKVETKIYKLEDEQLKKSLGKKVEIPNVQGYTRTQFRIKSVGTLEKTPAGEVYNDPVEWQTKASMRYNLLFTQVIQILVPCNPQLVAGDTIICNFETVTQESKTQGPDPVQSGKYLILNLCHKFNATNSYTSLTLVRDSYGLYTNKNK